VRKIDIFESGRSKKYKDENYSKVTAIEVTIGPPL